jgi:hypothetical protein
MWAWAGLASRDDIDGECLSSACLSRRSTGVTVMQSADKGKLDDLALVGRLNWTRNRAVTFRRPVGSMAVIVVHVFPNHSIEMPFET